ncbi:unnamed protein product, partial [Ixodes hexagonus]
NFLFHPCRTISVTSENEAVAADAVGIVAASSRFGLLFAGCTQGVKVYRLEDVQNCDAEEGPGSKAPAGHCPFRALPTTGPVLLVALSADDLTLAVGLSRDAVPVVDMYDIRGFAHQVTETRPIATVRLSSQPGVGLRDFSWNPVLCEMFAACLTDGSVANYELAGEALRIQGTLPASVGGMCLAWSPKGKQLVVGKQNGGLSQFKPNMQEAKALTPPTIFENPVCVLSVAWLAPTVFAAVYAPSSQTADAQTSLVIVSFSKTTPVTYINFGEPCLKTGDYPSERFWLYHQPDWGILVCNSRNSVETAVLGCRSADKMNWELWELDSHGRAEVPLKNSEEAFPLGQAVIYSAQRNIVGKLESWPPMPILTLMATSGGLSPFHMKNLVRGAPSLVRPPEALTPQGQRRPMANPPQPQQQRPVQAVPPVASSGFPSLGQGTGATMAPFSTAASLLQSKVSTVPAAPQPQFGLPGTMVAPAFSFSSPAAASSTTVTSFSSSNSFMPLNPTASSAPAPASSSLFSLPASSATAFSFGSSANSVFSFGSSANSVYSFGSTAATSAPKTTPAVQTTVLPPSAVATVTAAAVAPGFSAAPAALPAMASSAPGSNTAATVATASTLPAFPATPVATAAAPAVSANAGFGFGGGALKAVTSSAPFGFKPASKSALEAPAAAASLPASTPVQAPQEAQSPRVAETGATAQPKRNLHDGSSQPAPAMGDRVTPAQHPQKPEHSKDAIIAAMEDEIAEFGKELGAFKERALCAFEPVGTEAEMKALRRDGVALQEACDRLKGGVETTNEEVHALGVLVLETFAMLEEGRTQELRNRDPRFAGLLKGRGLDPTTAQRLAEVRQLRQYLEAQLREVHSRLDLDWQEHLARRNNKKLVELPSSEAVYRAALSCRKVTAALSSEVDALASRVKGLKLKGKRGQAHDRPHWAQAPSGSLVRQDEVSALADTLLSANLSAIASDAGRTPSKPSKVTLSPEKQSSLAEFLSQRSPVPVRARTIDKLSESRLMSKLAVVLNKSMAEEREKETGAKAPQQGASLPVSMAPEAPTVAPAPEVPAAHSQFEGFATALATPKPPESSGQGFLTSTPLAQSEQVVRGISPGGPPVRVVTSDQGEMPASRVIEVSVQPRPDTGAPPHLPPGLTLTPVSSTAAPPVISAAAVTNVVTKPLATRTETTVTSKEAGTAAFLSTMSQPKFKLPGVAPGSSATVSSSSSLTSTPVFSFGMPSGISTASSGAPSSFFGFGDTTSGAAVPTTFKLGESSVPKPGFVAVKPSTTVPSFFVPQPTSSSAAAAPKKQTEEVVKSKAAASAVTPAPAPASPVFSFATSTTGAMGFPVATSVGSPSFKLNFGQGTGVSKSLFGNTSVSTPGATSAAAAFSFTAALSAQRESAPTSVFAAPQTVVASKVKDVPRDKPLPVTPVATLGLNLSPSGPSALKPAVTSSVGLGVPGSQNSGTSPFQPVPAFGSQATDVSSAAATGTTTTVHTPKVSPVHPYTFAVFTNTQPSVQPAATKPATTETNKVTSTTTAPATATMAPSAFPSMPPPKSVVASSSSSTTTSATDVAPKATAAAVTSSAIASPAVSSTASVFGQGSASVFAAASNATPFGQPSSASVPQSQAATPTSSAAGPTGAAAVFGQAKPAASSASLFGQQPTTASTMPSSVFGSTAVTSSAVASFGKAMPFGQTTTAATAASSAPSPFGQAPPSTATAAPSLFGQTATSTTTTSTSTAAAPFWKPVASATPPAQLFGGSATAAATTPFGSAAGATPSAFGQASMFSYGQTPGAAVSASSPFGNMMATTPASNAGTSLFGQKTSFGMGQSSTSLFGGSQGQSVEVLLRCLDAPPTLGLPSYTCHVSEVVPKLQHGTGSITPSDVAMLAVGRRSAGQEDERAQVSLSSRRPNASPLALTNAGEANISASAVAASASRLAEGESMIAASLHKVGGGTILKEAFPLSVVATVGEAAAFGGAPAFGGSPTFGGPPQFGGSPTFGGSPAFGASPFGASQSPQQQQQQPQAQQPTGFSAFGNVEGPTFGALAAQGSPGTPQQQPQGALGFGSAFGSPPSFGTPGFGDQSNAQNPPSAFSQWRQ